MTGQPPEPSTEQDQTPPKQPASADPLGDRQRPRGGKTFGERVVDFNLSLRYQGSLPEGFQVLNPFLDNPETQDVMRAFYGRFYADQKPRKLLLGINPSRHGAGVTGVPFTDTKRLEQYCGIRMGSAHTHEISSVFVYDMIQAYGGVERFYGDYYINSPFPLALVRTRNGRQINANYYDDQQLLACTEPFMIACLRAHIQLGLDTSRVYVLGAKNLACIDKLNRRAKLLGELLPLEHPRYIQQYKSKERSRYIDKFVSTLQRVE